ncbi:MAG: hypothetical protein NZL83_02330 [Candidatus Absconditabacterales bacterium]|nr:hypothetical protein [Candidatus Absconditabacterales bacterium]
MQGDLLLFGGLGIALVLGTMSALLGPDKLLKLVLGNIVFMFFILVLNATASFIYDSLDDYQATLPVDQRDKGTTIQAVVSSIPLTLGLVLYSLFLFLMFTKVGQFITLPRDGLLYPVSHIVLIPLTIIGFVLVLVTIVMGVDALIYPAMKQTASVLGGTGLTRLLRWFPLVLLGHTIAVVTLTYHCVRKGGGGASYDDVFENEG